MPNFFHQKKCYAIVGKRSWCRGLYIFFKRKYQPSIGGKKIKKFQFSTMIKKTIQIQLKSTSWNFFDHFMKISASIFLNLSHPRGRLPQFGRRLNDWPDFYCCQKKRKDKGRTNEYKNLLLYVFQPNCPFTLTDLRHPSSPHSSLHSHITEFIFF